MKKFFKRHAIDRKILLENKYLRIFGRLLQDHSLWLFNRHTISRAFAIGLFCAFVPIPFQMVLAAGAAILMKRTNLPISVALVWITNPITIPPMFYFAYKLGTILMAIPPQPFNFELSLDWLFTQVGNIWEPLLLGSFVCGIISAIVGYLSVRVLWRMMIVRAWRARKRQK